MVVLGHSTLTLKLMATEAEADIKIKQINM